MAERKRDILFGDLLDFGKCGLSIGSVPRRAIIAADGFEFAPSIGSFLARFHELLAELVYFLRDRLLLGCDLIEVGGRALVAQGRDRQTIPILCQRSR